MLEWMIMPLKRYADFSGRSRRKEYWSFFLLNFFVMAVIAGIIGATGPSLTDLAMQNAGNPTAMYGAVFGGVGLLLVAWWLGTLIPNIAVNVRRLHDRNMSGWFLLGYFILAIIPVLGLLVSIAWLVLMCLEGTRGPNKYGPDPKDPTSAQVFA